ncbi:MAG: TonB-dependent receptor plug domain-containing protein, partial [Bacteroides sp.]|nr:TonB-dependent receptor plug domain-containing protein [Bacteroides sp.]
MLKHLRSVSVMLFLMGASTGAAYAISNTGTDDVKITQQSGTCTGIVKDATGETVIGASVVVKGTTNGVITGVNGDFSLTNVKKGDVIQVSFVGYKTQEITWDGKSMNIVLEDDTQTLQEVVVTALGLPKQAKSVGYATTRVSTTEIERANAINPVNALQGKVAGVQINVGGASGVTSSSSITIRGAKSVDKNNSPIWVVDGMVLQEALTGNLSGTDWGSQLKNLNPADYESVTVLKGAAATALYGSRGATGAIVIKPKTGKVGKQGLGV